MEIVRGDTAQYKFQRIDNNGNVITEIADKVYFTVKENYDTKIIAFQKTIEDMTFDENYYYHFVINPEDTNELNYGDYVYDVEVIKGSHKQTISKGIFKISEEVTFYINEV